MTLSFSAACGGSSEKGSDTESDGLVQGAYGKVAAAFCERYFACVEETNGLKQWASVDDCANNEIKELSVFGATTCVEQSDFPAHASDLTTCVDSLAKMPCERLQGGALLYAARVGLFPDCLPVAEQLADAEAQRLWSDKSSPGQSCRGDDDCTWDAYCTAEARSCGMCKRYPQPGESCMENEDLGRAICGFGLVCRSDSKCVDHLPKQGEPCGTVDECDVGLDCNEQLKCAKMYAPDDACDSEASAPCGQWLSCTAGKCVGPGNIAKADTACSGGDCRGGRCVDGRCSEFPDLGETCDEDCLEPYVCVDGVCAAIPECATGAPGAVCSDDTQCQPGHDCEYDDVVGQDVCTLRLGGAREPCRGDGSCDQGRCTDGICTLLPEGATCDPSASECELGSCDAGRCTPEPPCE